MALDRLFMDIETVPEYPTFDQMPEQGQRAFLQKFKHDQRLAEAMAKVEASGNDIADIMEYNGVLETIYQEKAGLLAEFCKIVCISLGAYIEELSDTSGNSNAIKVKSFVGDEEWILRKAIESMSKSDAALITSHNGKSFDFPVFSRRCLIHGVPLPERFQVAGKWPREIMLEDTMELWKFTEWKYFVSLASLCYAFGIKSSKEEMDGSLVHRAFLEGRIDDIANYCCSDVVALANVSRHMRGLIRCINSTHLIIKA